MKRLVYITLALGITSMSWNVHSMEKAACRQTPEDPPLSPRSMRSLLIAEKIVKGTHTPQDLENISQEQKEYFEFLARYTEHIKRSLVISARRGTALVMQPEKILFYSDMKEQKVKEAKECTITVMRKLSALDPSLDIEQKMRDKERTTQGILELHPNYGMRY